MAWGVVCFLVGSVLLGVALGAARYGDMRVADVCSGFASVQLVAAGGLLVEGWERRR